MSRWLFAALLILTAASSKAAELGGRLVAVLLTAAPGEQLRFTVSPDRKTVYAVTWQAPAGAHQASETRLHVIDVAAPASPRPLNDIPLGDFITTWDISARGTKLFVLVGPGPNKRSVVIVDVHDPLAPVVQDRVEVGGFEMTVAESGSCFGIKNSSIWNRSLNTFSEPFVTFLLNATGQAAPGPCPGLTPDEKYGHDVPLDRRENERLFLEYEAQVLFWKSGGPHEPGRGIYVPGMEFDTARFIASPSVLAAVIHDAAPQSSARQLVLLNGDALPFDAAPLKQAHETLIQEYKQVRAAAPDGLYPYTFDGLSERLGAAGAEQALAAVPDGITKSDLVPILNDWGFWRSRGTQPSAAIPILQRVVEIDPARAVAWRNLGDAARTSISGPVPGPERIRLTHIALDAYDRFLKLAGHLEPDMRDFIELNVLNEPSDDVCRIVAEYYSRGRQREISGIAQPVDVDGSGRKVNLEVEDVGRPYDTPSVKVTSMDGEPLESEPAFAGDIFDRIKDYGNIVFIPFGKTIYALYETAGAPAGLADWTGHAVCYFTPHYKALVAQSRDDNVCGDLARGPLTRVQPTTVFPKPKPVSIDAGDGMSFWSDIENYDQGIKSVTEVDLSGSGHMDRIGNFTGFHPHSGCSMAGVALMDGEEQEASARNAALLVAERNLQDCGKADAAIVRAHGRNYVEIDSSKLLRNRIERRTLLRITKTGAEIICPIVDQPSYTGIKN